MAHGRGAKAQLRAYYEVAYAEAIAARNGVRLPASNILIGKTQGKVQSDVLQGNRSQTMPSADQIGVAGGTMLQPDVRSIGYVLRQLLGGYSVSGPVAGLYTHTFLVDAILGSLMLEKWFSDLAIGYQYVGCKPNGLSWDIGIGGLQKCNVDWIGKDELPCVAPEDASPLLQPVRGFSVPSVTLLQGGVALTDATRFNFNIANNMEGTRTVGNAGMIADVVEGVIAVTFDCEIAFRSAAQYNKALAGTEEAILITYPAPGGMSLQWLLDEVQYNVNSIPVNGGGPLSTPMSGVAYYDDAAAGSAIRAILVNDVATYATIP